MQEQTLSGNLRLHPKMEEMKINVKQYRNGVPWEEHWDEDTIHIYFTFLLNEKIFKIQIDNYFLHIKIRYEISNALI